MSLIHQKMYQERELSNIQFESYFNDLIDSILRSSLSSDVKFDVKFHTNMHHLNLETIVPLGLLLNELITNSFKHAFTPGAENSITIVMNHLGENGMSFEYNDSGLWNPEHSSEGSFGQELIEVLSMQLNGNIERTNSCYRLEIADLS
jgi:two-component sensor histidine kinase